MRKALVIVMLLLFVSVVSAQRNADLQVFEPGSGTFSYTYDDVGCWGALENYAYSATRQDGQTRAIGSFIGDVPGEVDNYKSIINYADHQMDFLLSGTFDKPGYKFDTVIVNIDVDQNTLTVKGSFGTQGTLGTPAFADEETLEAYLLDQTQNCDGVSATVNSVETTNNSSDFEVEISPFSAFQNCGVKPLLKAITLTGVTLSPMQSASIELKLTRFNNLVSQSLTGTYKGIGTDLDLNITGETTEIGLKLITTTSSLYPQGQVAKQIGIEKENAVETFNITASCPKSLSINARFAPGTFSGDMGLDLSFLTAITLQENSGIALAKSYYVPLNLDDALQLPVVMPGTDFKAPFMLLSANIVNFGRTAPLETVTVTLSPLHQLINPVPLPDTSELGVFTWNSPSSMFITIGTIKTTLEEYEPFTVGAAALLLALLTLYSVKLMWSTIPGGEEEDELQE